jgi:phosphatidyl-myo-inositol dimannoside synthase
LTRYVDAARQTVCISRYTERVLRTVWPKAPPSSIVYPCVSRQVLEQPTRENAAARLRERLGWPMDSALVALTIARISERKNQLGVLRALASLRGRSPLGFRYVIVGNVDAMQHQAYSDQLKEFCRAHHLEESVGWISRASDAEKIECLDGCDIFLMLSRTAGTSVEGFGISALEASARGKPVIVSSEGGMPETIIEGRTGFAVAPTDPDSAAEAMVALAADPATRTRMGEAGRLFAREGFTPRVMASQLHASIAAGPPSPTDR